MQTGNDPRTPLPSILGHEGVGYVREWNGNPADANGNPLREGDLVTWNRGVTCGKCYFCREIGQPSLCPNRWVYGISHPCTRPPYLNGCYAQAIILAPGTEIYPLPSDVDPCLMVPASCSGATIAHAFDLLSPDVGRNIVIQGPGPLGAFAVLFAVELGFETIVVIGDANDRQRLGICRQLGAAKILRLQELPEKERRDAVLDLTDGRGADAVIEATGHPAAVEEGLKLLRSGGEYISAGFGDPAGSISLDCFHDLVRPNRRIQGVWVSDARHLSQALDLTLSHLDLVALMITDRLPLSEANEALRRVKEKESLKVVMTPEI